MREPTEAEWLEGRYPGAEAEHAAASAAEHAAYVEAEIRSTCVDVWLSMPGHDPALQRRRDQWVNARIELLVPLNDVAVTATAAAKQDAVVELMDRIMSALPEDLVGLVVGVGRWEDVDEGANASANEPSRNTPNQDEADSA